MDDFLLMVGYSSDIIYNENKWAAMPYPTLYRLKMFVRKNV